ncbi:MAG: hypothetical protein IKK89_06950 [Alistipes sp.]|nr:hypothetical protein [Alistipes sp.]
MIVKPPYVFDINPEWINPYDDEIGIVINLEDYAEKQFHCGLSFDLNTQTKVLHLTTHNRLRCDYHLNSFRCWIRPNIHKLRQEQVSIFCNVIVDRGLDFNDIPYGFSYDGKSYFENDGSLVHSANCSGYTCGTFVLTIFHSLSLDLIDISAWPSREEDITWQIRILKRLLEYARKLGISNNHLLRLANEIGCPRYRPEEVAVSSTLYDQHNGTPANCQSIITEGGLLNTYMMNA